MHFLVKLIIKKNMLFLYIDSCKYILRLFGNVPWVIFTMPFGRGLVSRLIVLSTTTICPAWMWTNTRTLPVKVFAISPLKMKYTNTIVWREDKSIQTYMLHVEVCWRGGGGVAMLECLCCSADMLRALISLNGHRAVVLPPRWKVTALTLWKFNDNFWKIYYTSLMLF